MTPAHEGGHRRAPVRQRGAGRGDRGARRARSSRTPPRPPARWSAARRRRRARHRGHVLVLPVQEPRGVRRRRRGHHRRRRRRRAAADAALPRLARQGRPSSRSATTRASTSCRPRSCACSCRTSTLGRRPPRAARAATRRPASATSSRCPCRPEAARPAWHLYVIRHAQADALAAALKAARDRAEGLLPGAGPPPARDARVRERDGDLPGTDEAAAHAPGDPHEPGALAAPRRRGRGRRARCGSGLT